jgi:hypothetical protein
MIRNSAAHRRCNEVFWTGLKIDPGVHFSTLNIETRGVEFRPYPVENWAGPWNFDHKPGSKFNSIKACNIYIHGLFNQKLEFHSGFYPSVCLFCFWFIMSQIDRSFPATRAWIPNCWKIKKKLKKCIHHVYITYSSWRQEHHPLSKMTPLPLETFYRQLFFYGTLIAHPYPWF